MNGLLLLLLHSGVEGCRAHYWNGDESGEGGTGREGRREGDREREGKRREGVREEGGRKRGKEGEERGRGREGVERE